MASLHAIPLPRFARPKPMLPPLVAMWRALVTRRQLAQMDDRMLRDIGLSRAEALHEANRWPWDLQQGC
jgi:uncharacterized protein YjiS (DUF1127 family)